jgi:hypothetical protein
VAFLKVNALRGAWGQKLVTTIFAKNRCIGANVLILIREWDFSSSYGQGPKKLWRKSMLEASTPGGKGTLETGKTGTPSTKLISWGST